MKRLLFIIFIALCVTACYTDDEPTPSVNEQTVLLYLPWSSNLTGNFQTNISDFEEAIKQNILKSSRVLVLFASSTTEATLFELSYEKGNSKRTTIKDYTNPAFTTTAWITSILNDVKNIAPANRYAMIIGCHGMGWIPVQQDTKTFAARQKYHFEYDGPIQTRFFGGLTSEYQTEISTLKDGIQGAGMKMEYLLFDDCYMSNIEVAYELKDVAGYLIGCPTEVMAYGMPYAKIAPYLIGNVNYEEIGNEFLKFYQNYTLMPCGTLGITNCSEVEELAGIMKEINTRYTFDPSLTSTIQRLDGYEPTIFFDYGDYVSKLCTDPELLTLFNNQLERVVPSRYRKHTEYYYTTVSGRQQIKINTFSGITISDPSTHVWASTKAETDWYKATH